MEPVDISEIFQVDKLISASVPHILEKIFFSLDFGSFNTCLAVSPAWNELLSSECFLKLKKGTIHKSRHGNFSHFWTPSPLVI